MHVGLSGLADLPLHEGHVPPWLYRRMVKLSGLIMRLLVDEHGVRGTVRLFSNPYFFQAFNNVIGMDWDSSGSTTVTTAALKEALGGVDIGVKVVGGKGKYALRVPDEVRELSRVYDIDAESLIASSRLVAKVDGVALQDGYAIYHHSIIVGEDGSWTIIQQGMNTETRYARRYHWWMETSYIEDPHEGIVGVKGASALNLVSRLSRDARGVIVDLVNQGVEKVARDWRTLRSLAKANGARSLLEYMDSGGLPYYNPRIPREFLGAIRGVELNVDALREAKGVGDFKGLLLVRGIGPSTMLALALIAQLVYSAPIDWNDPVTFDPRRFAFAVGGKDGSPYPVSREVYDSVIGMIQGIADKISRDPGLRIYMRHLASAARRLNLPLDLVRPT